MQSEFLVNIETTWLTQCCMQMEITGSNMLRFPGTMQATCLISD